MEETCRFKGGSTTPVCGEPATDEIDGVPFCAEHHAMLQPPPGARF